MAKHGGGRNVRLLRVGENLRHALSDILSREEVRDPELFGRSITVSEVDVSPDLRHATVFVVPLGGERAEAAATALNRHAGPIRAALGRKVEMKYLPRLRFAIDESFAEAERVEALLNSEKVRGDLDRGED